MSCSDKMQKIMGHSHHNVRHSNKKAKITETNISKPSILCLADFGLLQQCEVDFWSHRMKFSFYHMCAEEYGC